jgi:hypothetical protein
MAWGLGSALVYDVQKVLRTDLVELLSPLSSDRLSSRSGASRRFEAELR